VREICLLLGRQTLTEWILCSNVQWLFNIPCNTQYYSWAVNIAHYYWPSTDIFSFLRICFETSLLKTNTASVFRRIQNCNKRLLASSCPSGCPSVRMELEQFSWNLIFQYFSKNCREKWVSFKSDKNNGYSNLKRTKHFW